MRLFHSTSTTVTPHRLFDRARGQSTLFTVGIVMFAMMSGVLFADVPTYFYTYRQLQTVTDAAALAGASKLPLGDQQAKDEALEVAQLNPLKGGKIKATDLTFTVDKQSMTVKATTKVPTLFGQMVCGGSCMSFNVTATSKALPAARDTVLVLDNSSSMTSLGNNRPLKDVRNAANLYVDEVSAYDSLSVDRIGVVKFNYDGTELIELTSKTSGGGFAAVKNKITNLAVYNAQGWNTNYYSGLKLALDELEQNGRPNANKQIIFFTDGKPNLPAPASYYSYSYWQPYNKCVDMVNNSAGVKALCTNKLQNGKWVKVCPTMPNPQITPNLIPNNAYQCGLDYTNHMTNVFKQQVDRAKTMGVTITTIVINDDNGPDNAESIIAQLIKQPNWEPDHIQYAATTTGGQQYYAKNYDSAAISDIYEQIADDVHIKLAG